MGTDTIHKFIYDMDGRKLYSNLSTNWILSDEMHYCQNMIYKDGKLDRIMLDGCVGYITAVDNQFHYFTKDHLGNNRLVVNANGTTEQVNHYYPYGGSFAEGLQNANNPYLYNGKELMGSLNLYDYGARYMDPMLGRFTTMDPLAERNYSISPYAYASNNPINRLDPTGKIDYNVNVNGYIYQANPIKDAVRSCFGFTDKYDRLIAVDNRNKTLVMPHGSMGEMKSYTNDSGRKLGDYVNVANDNVAKDTYEFLSENTGVEFSRVEVNDGKQSDNIISTSHDNSTENVGPNVVTDLLDAGINVESFTHSHLERGYAEERPSGYVPGQSNSGDKTFVNGVNKAYPHNTITHKVYDVPQRQYIYYNNNNIYKYEKK